VKAVFDSEHVDSGRTTRRRGGTNGTSVVIVVVWLAFGWLWLGVVLAVLDAINEDVGFLWFLAGSALAVVVLCWMVRGRGSPRRVGALACWWAGACVVAPFALVLLLPLGRPFRERSLQWVEGVLSREHLAAGSSSARPYVNEPAKASPSSVRLASPGANEALPELTGAGLRRREVDQLPTRSSALVLGGAAVLYLFVPLQIVSEGFVLTSDCLTDDTVRVVVACATAGVIAGGSVLSVGLLNGWRWWLALLAGIAVIAPAGVMFLLLVGLSGGGGDCPTGGDEAAPGSVLLLPVTRLAGRLTGASLGGRSLRAGRNPSAGHARCLLEMTAGVTTERQFREGREAAP
jgi:hypothetical protein